jgi:hypothetical protein
MATVTVITGYDRSMTVTDIGRSRLLTDRLTDSLTDRLDRPFDRPIL